MKKKLAVLFSVIFLLTSCISPVSLQADGLKPVTVKLNGNFLSFDQPPIIENGRTLVPFRVILEAMGAEINWDSATKTITCTKDAKTVILTVGSTNIIVNNVSKTIDVPAKIVNDRTLIPLRAVSENFDAEVNWDNAERLVTITSSVSTEQSTTEQSITEQSATEQSATETVITNNSLSNTSTNTENDSNNYTYTYNNANKLGTAYIYCGSNLTSLFFNSSVLSKEDFEALKTVVYDFNLLYAETEDLLSDIYKPDTEKNTPYIEKYNALSDELDKIAKNSGIAFTDKKTLSLDEIVEKSNSQNESMNTKLKNIYSVYADEMGAALSGILKEVNSSGEKSSDETLELLKTGIEIELEILRNYDKLKSDVSEITKMQEKIQVFIDNYSSLK